MVLSRIMLAMLAVLIVLALLFAAGAGLESPSYLIALAAGALAAGTYLAFRRSIGERVALRDALYKRLGAKQTAAVLAVLCFAVNLVWILVVRIEPFSDYQTYWGCACTLAFGDPMAANELEYISVYPHILGYSSFLSLFLRLFGRHVMVGAVLNVVLTAASGLVIYRFCCRVLGDESAVVAFLLWIFLPSRLMLNSLIFSEPLYTFLVLAFLLCVTELDLHREELCGRYAVCIAAGLGLGVILRCIHIVRPIAAILIIALVIWLVFLRRGDLKNGRLWISWGIILAVLLCVYSVTGKLWDTRVTAFTGEEPASVPIYNIYVGFNEETQGQWSAEDMDLLFEHKHSGSLSAAEAQESMLPHLRERLRSGIDFAGLFRSKLTAFMANDELGGYTYRYTRPELFVKICMVIDNVYYYMLLFLVLAGLWRMGCYYGLTAPLLCPLFALGLTLAHMLVEVSVRYHYSLLPVFIIIAAYAVPYNKKSLRRSA